MPSPVTPVDVFGWPKFVALGGGSLLTLSLAALSLYWSQRPAGGPMNRRGKVSLVALAVSAGALVILLAWSLYPVVIGAALSVWGSYRALTAFRQGALAGIGATGFAEVGVCLVWRFRQRATKRREAQRQEEQRQRDREAAEREAQRQEAARQRTIEAEEHAQRLATEEAEHKERLAAEEARIEAKERKANMDEFTKVYRQKCAPLFTLALHFFRSTGEQKIPERKAVSRMFEVYAFPSFNQALQKLDSKLSEPPTDLETIKPLLTTVIDNYLNVTREILDIGPLLLGDEFANSCLNLLKSRAECMSGLESLCHLPGMHEFIAVQLATIQLQDWPQPTI